MAEMSRTMASVKRAMAFEQRERDKLEAKNVRARQNRCDRKQADVIWPKLLQRRPSQEQQRRLSIESEPRSDVWWPER